VPNGHVPVSFLAPARGFRYWPARDQAPLEACATIGTRSFRPGRRIDMGRP
jgi:hypothetical protein